MEDAWKKEMHKLFASTKTPAEAKELLMAILTPKEYDEVASRWQIVQMLLEGNPQREIRDQLGVSIATVTRGAREVQHGSGTFQKYYHRLHPSK